MGEAGPQNDVAAGRLDRSGHQVSPGHGDERRRPEVHGGEEDGTRSDGKDDGKQVSSSGYFVYLECEPEGEGS